MFDTHVHLDDEQFREGIEQVLARARDVGVTAMIAVGTTTVSSIGCVAIASRHSGVYAAVGIHPNYCHEATADDWHTIVQLADAPSTRAIGETGLDRHWDHAPFDLQEDYFDRHLRLSQQRDLPFIVHMRECSDDILRMLIEARRRGPLRGIMHSFTGDRDMMQACVDLGMHISFAGMVTFKKSTVLRDVAAAVPVDRLLMETDAPYLSPHPVRSRRPNEPALMVHTAECLAAVRSMSLTEIDELTTRNACELFRV